jgi:hypothetical protein
MQEPGSRAGRAAPIGPKKLIVMLADLAQDEIKATRGND